MALTLPIFAFEPNWSTDPALHFHAQTDVDLTPSGREERTIRIPVPAIGFGSLIDSQDVPATSRAIIRFMRANIGQALIIPLWSEIVTITEVSGTQLSASQLSTRLFAAGRACVLWRNPDYCEAFLPAANGVTATTVTSSTAFVNSWQAGDYLVPAIITAPLSEDQVNRWITGYQTQGDASFSEAIDQAVPFSLGIALPMVQAFPLFPFRYNRAQNDLEETTARQVSVQKSDVGLIAATATETPSRQSIKGDLFLQDRPQFAMLATFFAATLGRGHKFWLPSDNPDFVLTAPNAGDDTLVVQWTGYTENELADPARQLIIIRDVVPNGNWHVRRIVSAVDNDNGTETLTLESAVPVMSITAVVSFVYLVRSMLDEYALTMHGTEAAQLPVEFIELPQEIILTGSFATDGAVGGAGHLTAAAASIPTPLTPANLTAVAVDSTDVLLSWSASAGATQYGIFRNGTLVATVNSTGGLQQQDTDAGLTQLTTYNYQIAALNSAGPSALSAPVPVTTPATPVTTSAPTPPTPTSLILMLKAQAGTVLSFTAQVFDQYNVPMVGVVVRFSVSGANTASASATTYTTGYAAFTYTAIDAGTDTIYAYADIGDTGSYASPDPQASMTLVSAAQADLEFTSASASPNPCTTSENTVVTFILKNNGSVATTSQINLSLNASTADWTYVSATGSASTVAEFTFGGNSIITLLAPPMAAGATVTFAITLTPLLAGTFALTANASYWGTPGPAATPATVSLTVTS